MLAQGVDVDFFDDDHVLAIFVEDGITDHIPDGLFVAFGKENQCLKRNKIRYCRSLTGTGECGRYSSPIIIVDVYLLQQRVLVSSGDLQSEVGRSCVEEKRSYPVSMDLLQHSSECRDSFA